jgi:hypothetical protein
MVVSFKNVSMYVKYSCRLLDKDSQGDGWESTQRTSIEGVNNTCSIHIPYADMHYLSYNHIQIRHDIPSSSASASPSSSSSSSSSDSVTPSSQIASHILAFSDRSSCVWDCKDCHQDCNYNYLQSTASSPSSPIL